MEYVYYMTRQPAGHGCQPENGLIKVADSQEEGAYSVITYDRELTDEEVCDYGLKPELDFRYNMLKCETMEAFFKVLYDGSWYTITGAGGDIREWLEGYERNLAASGLGKPKRWARFTGKDMNDYLNLTGDDRYKDDYRFLAFSPEGMNISRLAYFRITWKDYWFDDIVSNIELKASMT